MADTYLVTHITHLSFYNYLSPWTIVKPPLYTPSPDYIDTTGGISETKIIRKGFNITYKFVLTSNASRNIIITDCIISWIVLKIENPFLFVFCDIIWPLIPKFWSQIHTDTEVGQKNAWSTKKTLFSMISLKHFNTRTIS